MLRPVKTLLICPAIAMIATSSAPAAQPTKDELISGIVRNYEAYRRIKTLRVNYTLDYEPLTQPARFGFTHQDILNLSRSSGACRTHIQATGVRGVAGTREDRLVTWDTKIGMVMRNSAGVTIDTRPDNLLYYYRYFADYLYYPDGSAQVTSQPGAIPARQSDEWIPLVLPRLSAEYTLRPDPEVIDGASCYVLERPNRDCVWVDPACGFLVRRRDFYQAGRDELRSRTLYVDPAEAQGFWYPKQIRREDFAPPIGKPDARFSKVSRFKLTVTDVSIAPVPDSEFRIKIPSGAQVTDGVRKLSYVAAQSSEVVVAKTLSEAEAIVHTRSTAWEYTVVILGGAVGLLILSLAVLTYVRASTRATYVIKVHETNRQPRSGMTLIETLVVIAIISVLTGLLLAGVQRVREAAARTGCQNNLRQLGLALANYESQTGSFPSLKLDERQVWGYSWAVVLLPFLEQESLHRRFDLTRECNESPNAEAAGVALKVFQCPSVENPRFADYVRVLGTNVPNPFATTDYSPIIGVDPKFASELRESYWGMWELLTKIRAVEIKDGLSNTIAFAEDAGRDQFWKLGRRFVDREPNSFSAWLDPNNGIWATASADQPPILVNYANNHKIYSFHASGAYVVMADASVRLLGTSASVPLVVALVTRAAGDTIPPE